MRDEHRRVITEELGVEPVEIDSALVSAQTRHRLYWCNWPVEMPKDKLTPVEMCRLQTLPDDYLDGIAPNTAMSLTGNGWTVDVIAHLLKGIECR